MKNQLKRTLREFCELIGWKIVVDRPEHKYISTQLISPDGTAVDSTSFPYTVNMDVLDTAWNYYIQGDVEYVGGDVNYYSYIPKYFEQEKAALELGKMVPYFRMFWMGDKWSVYGGDMQYSCSNENLIMAVLTVVEQYYERKRKNQS